MYAGAFGAIGRYSVLVSALREAPSVRTLWGQGEAAPHCYLGVPGGCAEAPGGMLETNAYPN